MKQFATRPTFAVQGNIVRADGSVEQFSFTFKSTCLAEDAPAIAWKRAVKRFDLEVNDTLRVSHVQEKKLF